MRPHGTHRTATTAISTPMMVTVTALTLLESLWAPEMNAESTKATHQAPIWSMSRS